MSLIIASNLPNEDEYGGTESNIYKPFSFRNDMSSILKIPPNSQIALQSAKITLSDSIVFSDDNKMFYFYFGQGIKPPAGDPFNTLGGIEDSSAYPIPCRLFFNKNNSEGQSLAANKAEFAQLVEQAINEYVAHPQLINRASVLQALDATGSFVGYEVSFTAGALSDNSGAPNYIPTSHIPRADQEVVAWKRTQRYSAITPAFPVEELALPWGTRASQDNGKGVIWDYTYDGAADEGRFGTLGIERQLSQSITFNVPPLINIGGVCSFIVNSAYGRNAAESAKWMVGLTRPSQKNLSLQRRGNINPPYYVKRNGTQYVYFIENYVDYCVWADNGTFPGDGGGFCFDGQLNVGQCVVNTNDLFAGQANLNQLPKFMSFDYWNLNTAQTDFNNAGGQGNGINLYAPLGPQANPPQADEGELYSVEFRVNGEVVEVWAKDVGLAGDGSNGNYYKVMGHDDRFPAAGQLKPLSQDCWNLQPLMSINNSGLLGGELLKELYIDNYTGANSSYATLLTDGKAGNRNGAVGWVPGIDPAPGGAAADYTTIVGGGWLLPLAPGGYSSWEQRIVRSGEIFRILDLMGRPFINRGSSYFTVPNAAVVNRVKYGTVSGAAPNATYDLQKPVLILQESNRYSPTQNAGLLKQLGFDGEPVVVCSAPAGAATFRTAISTSIPVYTSSKSIFVRVGNLTQTSTNMRAGISGSKIIAHLPRFIQDSSNQSGALYLEPNTLIYCDLNNSNELNISSLDLSLCYVDETLANSLIGNTILCFHIKQK